MVSDWQELGRIYRVLLALAFVAVIVGLVVIGCIPPTPTPSPLPTPTAPPSPLAAPEPLAAAQGERLTELQWEYDDGTPYSAVITYACEVTGTWVVRWQIDGETGEQIVYTDRPPTYRYYHGYKIVQDGYAILMDEFRVDGMAGFEEPGTGTDGTFYWSPPLTSFEGEAELWERGCWRAEAGWPEFCTVPPWVAAPDADGFYYYGPVVGRGTYEAWFPIVMRDTE